MRLPRPGREGREEGRKEGRAHAPAEFCIGHFLSAILFLMSARREENRKKKGITQDHQSRKAQKATRSLPSLPHPIILSLRISSGRKRKGKKRERPTKSRGRMRSTRLPTLYIASLLARADEEEKMEKIESK